MLDARADAYGHRLALVGPIARELGVTGAMVSDGEDAEVARAVGFTEIRVGRLPGGPPSSVAPYGLVAGARPVLSLVGEVVAVKRVAAGSGVSYGYTHRTTKATTLALIGLGYADGVPRLASNRAEVLVAGARRPLVGRIAMDQLVVDCGDDLPGVGSAAVLFGDPERGEPSAVEWGAWTEREPLALIAGLGTRIHREAR
jgi:alanine racemase